MQFNRLYILFFVSVFFTQSVSFAAPVLTSTTNKKVVKARLASAEIVETDTDDIDEVLDEGRKIKPKIMGWGFNGLSLAGFAGSDFKVTAPDALKMNYGFRVGPLLHPHFRMHVVIDSFPELLTVFNESVRPFLMGIEGLYLLPSFDSIENLKSEIGFLIGSTTFDNATGFTSGLSFLLKYPVYKNNFWISAQFQSLFSANDVGGNRYPLTGGIIFQEFF